MTICTSCQLPHEETQDPLSGFLSCIKAQRNAMEKLLNLVGQPGACRGCGVTVFWMVHNNGARTPYDPSGLNHFVSCPEAARFKRENKR